MASPVAKAATLVSLALLVLLLGLAASTASASRAGYDSHDGWDFAWGEEGEEADGGWGGWERRWGSGFAPGKGAFEHSASATGDGKSYSFSWSSDDAKGVHGGVSFAGNWKPQEEAKEEAAGAKAEK